MSRSYWIVSATPLAVIALGLLALGLLDLAGGECVYPPSPNRLDGAPTCNALGGIADAIGWWGPLWIVLTGPSAVIALAGGVVVARMRRNRRPR